MVVGGYKSDYNRDLPRHKLRLERESKLTDSNEKTGTPDPEKSSGVEERPISKSAQVESTKSQTPEPVSQPAQPSQPVPGKGLAVGAFILSIVALGAAGYAWYQTAVNARLAGGEQTSRISIIEERFKDVNTAQSGVGATIDQIQQRVANSETTVAEQVSKVKQLVSTTESALIGQISEVKQQLGTVESGIAEQIREVRSGVTAQQQDIENRVASSEQNLKSQANTFRDEFGVLADSIGEVKSELGTSVDQWSLREIEHLLVMANERLQLGQDPELARHALQIADRRLQEIDNPALLETRSVLSGEIAALTEIKQVDIAAVTNSLTLLSNTIADLPLLGIGDTTGPTKTQGSSDAGQDGEAEPAQSTGDKVIGVGRTFLADLGSLVQVEKDGKPVAPTITPEIQQLILAKGRLMLEGAQLALLRRQNEVYIDRLKATAMWVGEHFDTGNDQTAAWLEQLASLEQTSPEVEYPDISNSLESLRSVIGSGG